MYLTPSLNPAYGGVVQLNYVGGSLTVYYTSGRVSTFVGVSWAEVVAIAAAPTATIAPSATPVAELVANVIGKYPEGGGQIG